MICNNWHIYFFKLFYDDFKTLTKEVEVLAKKHPDQYRHHPKTKLLAAIVKAVFTAVPENPNHKKYKIGNTLGSEGKNYRRVKSEMPPRYRLFFRFFSDKMSIIYLWFNDENTLRKQGSKTDVYAVFRNRILNAIPKNYVELITESKIPTDAPVSEKKETQQ